MASRKSPYRVDGAPILRSLEQKNAWSLGVVRIVLNYIRGFHTLDKLLASSPSAMISSYPCSEIRTLPRKSDPEFCGTCHNYARRCRVCPQSSQVARVTAAFRHRLRRQTDCGSNSAGGASGPLRYALFREIYGGWSSPTTNPVDANALRSDA